MEFNKEVLDWPKKIILKKRCMSVGGEQHCDFVQVLDTVSGCSLSEHGKTFISNFFVVQVSK